MKNKYKKIYTLAHKSEYRNYTVRDLLDLKGKKKLTQIHVLTPEEAAAAEAANIDLIICPPSHHLKSIREAAPNTFLTCGVNYMQSSKEQIAKECFDYLKLGVDSIHTNSWNIDHIKYMSQYNVPLQGHVGFVPMKSTWTGGVKPFGKKSDEAIKIFKEIKVLEKIGVWAVEVECIPDKILKEITEKTKALTISIGSGISADIQFLFGEDILGYNQSSKITPRHAKKYRNFNKLHELLQKERIAAFKEYKSDVVRRKFPSKKHSISIEKKEFDKFLKFLDKESKE